ncbi:beta strand repeat-containing protein, partial [Flavobacterium denitrificans]|uniref:beta strand repeat-containing protein n=1 Tax=Flavobacterium denitrificans TaxID=281361 RepID=UPI001427AFF6
MGNLHTALSAAAGCNSITEIFVAAGTYNVGANSFIMRNNLAIYGGFDPLNGITDLTHNRIMPNASNGQGSILNGQNVRPVIWNVFTSATAMDNTAVLDGFTITGGSYSNGAGIRNEYASPTLRNLVIRGNIASVSGAGIYNSASNPVISNSVISGNHVLNAASDVSGAGITNANFSTPTIINATITGNSLTSALGTIRGAGICNQGFSVPVVYNSIIWNNLKNNNPTLAGADIENNGGNITLKNSITQGYTTGNTADNNLANTDPLFVGTDFQLSNTSPAINAGSNTFYPGLSAATKDLAGNPRLAGLVIDMGANENQSVITPDANLTVYVREGFTGNGSSWANATSNLQGAINSGATKVFVAVGSYSVPLPNSFRLKTGVAVYGGFDPVNGITDLTHNRILPNRGMGDGSVLTANNAGRVMENISCDNTAVLDGFTITGGYAETWSAGIYNHHNASPTLMNLVIKGNTSYYVNSTSYGGGIACWVQSSPIISNVIIKGNSAKIGAGVFVQGYSHPVITNTLITDNHVSAGGTGGGIALDNVDVSATLHNVTIAGNTGGVADALAINNTNTMDIKNSIVFGSILTVGSGTYTAQYSFIEGNSSTANGNIDATSITVNDIFTNPAAGDYSLRGAAFVVNKGNNTLFTGLSAATKDLAGNARLNGTDIDLGAYEFFIQPGANSIAYVRPAATGLGNGSSWADATGLLQLAIDATNVQKVYVATGNYPVGNHSFIMKNNVEIYGGFNPANNTTDWNTRTLPNKGLGDGSVLDGQNVRPVIWNYNNGLNTTAILDGFTLTNGTGSNGGAMYNYNTAPAFNNLVIRNNSATRGGGIYNQTASITLNNAVIKDNTVSNDGGGMYNVTNSSPVMTNVAFTGNTANNGGGMFSVTNSSPVVTNALFANNTAVNTGGAIINMTIDPLQLTNVTIANNTGTDPVYSTGTGSITFHNSIVFGTVSGPYTAQHSLVEGSSATANGNIDATGISAADVFTDNATGDYTLKNTSPAVNAGNNLLNNTATDLAGNARITGTNIDMGTYEFHCASTIDFSNVVFTDSIITYDGNPHSIIAQNIPSGAAVTYEITDANNQTILGNTATNAGVYIITATISDTAASCNTAIRTASLTINKSQSVITTNNTQTHLYDGTVKNVVATLNHNETTLVYTPQQGYTDVGNYPVTVSVSETANYLAATENVNLIIDSATITGVTFNNGTFTYDGTAHSIFVSGAPGGATVTYTGNAQTNAGTYTVNALVQMPNYNDLQLSATMTIDNAVFAGITFNNGTFT